MTAKETFQRIDELNILIRIKMKQIDFLRNALSITATPTDNVPVSHTKNVHIMADRVAALVDAEREADALVDELVNLKSSIMTAIHHLTDPQEAMFITERFIEGKATKDIAKENHYSRRWIQQIIKDGIAHLDVVLQKDFAEIRHTSPEFALTRGFDRV